MRSLLKTSTQAPDGFEEAKTERKRGRLAELLGRQQEKLYAEKRHSVLVVLQGLDGAGKDNAVKHVFDAVNPSGCRVKGFKVPSEEEAAHDFLWRIHKETPERGMIQIFNRSHYEDVLVPVVNGELKTKALEARYRAINAFEQTLMDAGTLVFKFMLHVGAEEQQQRLQERLTDPEKRWKFDPHDEEIFAQRNDYLRQYDHVFKHCQKAAPWHIIEADQKWYKSYRILEILTSSLAKEGLKFPKGKVG